MRSWSRSFCQLSHQNSSLSPILYIFVTILYNWAKYLKKNACHLLVKHRDTHVKQQCLTKSWDDSSYQIKHELALWSERKNPLQFLAVYAESSYRIGNKRLSASHQVSSSHFGTREMSKQTGGNSKRNTPFPSPPFTPTRLRTSDEAGRTATSGAF